MRSNRLFAILASALAVSCTKPPDTSVGPVTSKNGPSIEQMRQDLMGRDVLYYYNSRARRSYGEINAGMWSVGEGELEDFVVVRRFPNLKRSYGERTDEVHALVTLEGTDERIRGVLVYQYIKLDTTWKLLQLGARDGDRRHDFSFERIRKSDGKVVSRMSPPNAPTGPWRFASTEYSTPIPELRVR